MTHSKQQRAVRRTIAEAVLNWRKTGSKGYLKKAALVADLEFEDEFLNWLIDWTAVKGGR